jgi:N-acetyl-gamma-glutamyl-phosphate reductase
MEVTVPLRTGAFGAGDRGRSPLHGGSVPLRVGDGSVACSKEAIEEALSERYADEPFVEVMPAGAGDGGAEKGFLSAAAMSGRNDVEIYVTGTEDRVLLIARYDNLGKGASGSGVQCMNLMLGLPETLGLL